MATLLRQLAYVAVALVLGIYAFVFFRSANGWPAIKATQERIHTMQDENDRLQKEIETRKTRLEKTAHDEALQRRAVRQYTGKTLKNDLKIVLPPQPLEAPPPVSAGEGKR